MSLLVHSISLLAVTGHYHQPLRGAALARLPVIENGFVLMEGPDIAAYGAMSELPYPVTQFPNRIDATGRAVLPCWCDSHTHLVFPHSRELEFVDKLRGATYADIAAKGGGILNSAERLGQLTADELVAGALPRLQEAIGNGTGAIEIKSGYGLSVEGELKMLRAIRALQRHSPIPIKSTFLGAHAYPLAYRDDHAAYIRLLTDEMLPVIASEQLADYLDVFCETGFFSPQEMEQVVQAGLKYGLKPRLHVNQLSSHGGLQMALSLNAITVDHLEVMQEEDIRDVAAAETIGTLLPTAAFFLRMPFQPARQLIDAGAAVALASDFNPGSSPSSNMNLVVSMACIGMRMLPEEAINAATINGAFALELDRQLGSIAEGKRANLIITKPVPSLAYLPYAFGSNLVEQVIINGSVFSP